MDLKACVKIIQDVHRKADWEAMREQKPLQVHRGPAGWSTQSSHVTLHAQQLHMATAREMTGRVGCWNSAMTFLVAQPHSAL